MYNKFLSHYRPIFLELRYSHLSNAFVDATASNEDIELDDDAWILWDCDGGGQFKEFNVPILCENKLSFAFREDEYLDWNFGAPPTFLTSIATESTRLDGPSENPYKILFEQICW